MRNTCADRLFCPCEQHITTKSASGEDDSVLALALTLAVLAPM